MSISLVKKVSKNACFASQFIKKYEDSICSNVFNQLPFKSIYMVVITNYLNISKIYICVSNTIKVIKLNKSFFNLKKENLNFLN